MRSWRIRDCFEMGGALLLALAAFGPYLAGHKLADILGSDLAERQNGGLGKGVEDDLVAPGESEREAPLGQRTRLR